jgi:hypothetical protein
MKHKNGKAGGYLVGKKHSQGGIPIVNTDNPSQKIEAEDGEVIITAPAVKDNKVRVLKGTNRQILSQINQLGGGVSFAKGGEIPKSIKCSGRKYEYGGKIMTDYDIVKSCGCKHSGKKMGKGGSTDNDSNDWDISEALFKKEGNAIAKKLNSDEGYKILDSDPEIVNTTWSSGGCYPFARAMQQIFGGKLVFIWDRGIAQHVMLNVGKLYLDSDGVSDIGKKFKVAKTEGLKNPVLEEFDIKKIGAIGIGGENLVRKIVEYATSEGTGKMQKGGNTGDIYDDMNAQFPSVKKTMEKVKKFLIENGYTIIKEHEPDFDTDGSLELTEKIHVSIDMECEFSAGLESADGERFLFYQPTTSLKKLLAQIKEAEENKEFKDGGEIENQANPNKEIEQELIEAIKVLKAPPKHPLSNYVNDPKAFLSFIQEQATGLNPQRTSVTLPEGLTPELAFNSAVTLVGSEDFVLQSIKILPEETKAIIKKAWYGKIIPVKLRRVVAERKFEYGGMFQQGRKTLALKVPEGTVRNSAFYQTFKKGGYFDKGGAVRSLVPYRENSFISSLVVKQGGELAESKYKAPRIGLYAPRIELTYTNEDKIPVRKVNTSQGIFDFLWQIWNKDTLPILEQSYILYLNTNLRIIAYYDLSKGGITGTVVDPRLVVATAAQAGATNVVLAHNHPSGGLTPSRGDLKVTEQLAAALKETDTTLMDHLIITPDGQYYSFLDNGKLQYARGGKIGKSKASNDDKKTGIVEFTKMIGKVNPFVPQFQITYLANLFRGEEKQAAIDILTDLIEVINKIPYTYQTKNQSADEKIVYLHYFYGGSDWYIVEKDKGDLSDPIPGTQNQAYGYVILNGDLIDAEWGYISIEEIRQNEQIELDFYFTPVPFGELKKKWQDPEEEQGEEQQQGPEYSFVGGKNNSLDLVKFSSYATTYKWLDDFNEFNLLKNYEPIRVDEEDATDTIPEGYYLAKGSTVTKYAWEGNQNFLNRGTFESNLALLENRKAGGDEVEDVNTGNDQHRGRTEVVIILKAGTIVPLKRNIGRHKAGDKVELAFDFYEGDDKLKVRCCDQDRIKELFEVKPSDVIMPGETTGIDNKESDGDEKTEPGMKPAGGEKIQVRQISLGAAKTVGDYNEANRALRWILDNKKQSNQEYDITFADGFILSGSIDLEPSTFWKDKPQPFTWHINTFWNNIANSKPNPAFPTETDIQFAEAVVNNYDLGSAGIIENKKQPLKQASTTTNSQQVQINNQVRELIKEKGIDSLKYSAQELSLLKLYEGAGAEKGSSTDVRILDQFFTPMDICGKMWGMAIKHGFKFPGSSICEPAVGSGRFLSYIPSDAGAYVRAYDVDETAYSICKILYPAFDIRHKSFETEFFKGRRHIGLAGVTKFFDLVIGNPPYREYVSEYAPLGEKKETGAFTFEMYFIARGIDVLVPGGLLIYIIPNTFLSNDNKYNEFKEKLAKKCDFLDAYRLPNGVFSNTEVSTDIIVLRKK